MRFAFCSGVNLLWHPPGAQLSKQQVLRDSFVQQAGGNLREMTSGTAGDEFRSAL